MFGCCEECRVKIVFFALGDIYQVEQQYYSLKQHSIRLSFIQLQFSKNNMRNNFAQTLPFPRKDKEFAHSGPDDTRKNHNSSIDQTTKMSSLYADQSTLKTTELTSSFKTHVTINHQETQQKKINTYRGNQNSLRVAKFNPFFGKEKKQQAPKIERSPQKPSVPQAPQQLKESKTLAGVPMRSTLKTLYQTKGLRSLQRSFKKSTSRVQSPNMKTNNCISVSRCLDQNETGGRSLKLLQKQNQILREENELLKCEMTEIKKDLMSVASYKKEEAIANLRDTVKKEDSQIKELKLKLQISNKKVLTLNTLLENKDEEIEFLSNKISQLQGQILALKECNAEKIEYLKQKMTAVVRGYAQLEQKFNSEQQEWIAFTQKWMELKNTYLHRINFLQSYISSNQ